MFTNSIDILPITREERRKAMNKREKEEEQTHNINNKI